MKPRPDTGIPDRVAQARWERLGAVVPFAELARTAAKQSLINEAADYLAAIERAGLAVVDLPEPDWWVGEDGETRTPCWRLSWGESVTAWIEGVETPVQDLQEDLDKVHADALKMLAAVAACERFRAAR